MTLATTTSAAQLTTLATLGYAAGQSPAGGLVIDAAGNLYGTCFSGGDPDFFTGLGTLFKLPAGADKAVPLVRFNGPNGRYPYASLTRDAAGNIYGSTTDGGDYERGTVFKLDPAGQFNTLVSFNGANGSEPRGKLLIDGAGDLYGTTAGGSGTLFKIAADDHSLTTLATLNGSSEGRLPVGGLIADAAGNLYGTASASDPGYGTVFRYSPVLKRIGVRARFDGTNGRMPQSGLIADAAGNFYGTTVGDEFTDSGTVYKIAAGSSTVTTLVRFDGANGRHPIADLLLDAAGNLYGTTYGGGPNDRGTVFKVAAGTNQLTTLATFGELDGNPVAPLIADGAGNLFGTTSGSGSYDTSLTGEGTVFKLTGSGFVVAVPEPTGLMILLLGVPALSRSRGRAGRRSGRTARPASAK